MSTASVSDIYRFIGKYSGWETTADQSYGNSNKVVENFEFSKFLKKEWNDFDGLTLSNTTIDSFWKQVDNKNSNGYATITDEEGNVTNAKDVGAINSAEMENIKKCAELYCAKDEFLEEHPLEVPKEIRENEKSLYTDEYSKNWMKFVKADLDEIVKTAINKSSTKEDLTAALEEDLSQILIDNTAEQSEALSRALLTQKTGINYKSYNLGEEFQEELDAIIDKAGSDSASLNQLYLDIDAKIKEYAAKNVFATWTNNIARDTDGNITKGSNVLVQLQDGCGNSIKGVTYTAQTVNGVTIDSNGNVSGKPTVDDAFNITVTATYTHNGETKTVSQDIVIPAATSVQNPDPVNPDPDPVNPVNVLDMSNLTFASQYNAYTAPGAKYTGTSFEELYNSNAVIELYTGEYKCRKADEATDAVKQAFTNLLDTVINSLSSQLTDSTALKNARDVVLNQYLNNFSIPIGNRNQVGDAEVLHCYSDTNQMDSLVERIQGNSNYQNCIAQACNFGGMNTYSYGVSFTSLVDAIVSAYSSNVTKASDESDNKIYTVNSLINDIVAGNNVAENIQNLISAGTDFTLNKHNGYYYFECNGKSIEIEPSVLEGVEGLSSYTSKEATSRTGEVVTYSFSGLWSGSQSGEYTITLTDGISGDWDASVEEKIKDIIKANVPFGSMMSDVTFQVSPKTTWS